MKKLNVQRGRALWSALSLFLVCGLIGLATLTISGCRERSPNEPDIPGGQPMIPGSAGVVGVHVLSSLGNVGDFELDLFVTDTSGNLLSNLPDNAFQMLSGLDTLYKSLGCSSGSLPPLGPYSAEILLDQSNSMEWNDPMDLRLRAAQVFLHGMTLIGGGNEAQLSSFFNFASGGLRTYGPFTQDGTTFDMALGSLVGALGPSTPLYDAMYTMTDSIAMNAHNENKVLIVFTDGEDNDSYHSLNEAINRAKQSNIKVFAIALKAGLLVDSTTTTGDENALCNIAMQTGGGVMHTEDPQQAVAYYASLNKVLSGGVKFYRTKWHVELPQGQTLSGREIKAKVRIGDKNNASVIAPFVVRF